MEGLNVGAILLVYLGVLVFGITFLVAFGLLIARRNKPALITFAAGLLCTAVTTALATLSFLQKGQGFFVEGSQPTIVLTALSLVLAGVGQFIAALRSPGIYAAAFAGAAGSMVLLAAPLLPPEYDTSRLILSLLSLLGDIQAVSLLLAVLSLMIAVLPTRRRTLVLWTALAALGGIAGFGVGGACVTTRSTLLQGFIGDKEGFRGKVRVEVDVLGVRVSDETGFALILKDSGKDWQVNPASSVRAVSRAQAAWLYGPPAAGAIAGVVTGLIVALGMARLLVRQSGKGGPAAPGATAVRPPDHGTSSDEIKPA